MWFRFKRQAVPSRQAVPKPAARPSRLTPPKRRGRVSLVLETLEDRFAPATLMQTFYPPEPFAAGTGSGLGTATATSADFHVVAMPGADIDGVPDRGAAFVYSATTGALIATLVNPAPTGTFFGARGSLSLSGNLVVIGAPYDDAGATNSGQAYVFDATTGALLVTLANPSPASSDTFGESVAISGNTVVVGAPYHGTEATKSGEAYVFNATTGALVAILANPSPTHLDEFGRSIAISGNTVVVGNPYDDTGATDSGQAFVFDATTGTLLATLANPSPASGDRFGQSVAISGSTVVIGTPYDDTGATDSGQAYVFNATTGALIATLANPSPADGDSFSNLGVAVSGSTVAIAAPGNTYDPSSSSARIGHVSIFDATTGVLLDTIPNPANGPGDGFGRVSIWNNTVLVGAPYNDTQNTDQGAAYVFDIGEAVNRPTITSVAPFVGPTTGGIPIVIKGVNFLGVTGPAGVRFGANNATSYTVDSDTQITAVLPSGNGLVDVRVTNAGVTSAAGSTSKFQYTSTAAAVRFVVTGPTTVRANTAFSITVTALDAFGNIAVAYTGTVRITNSVSGNKMPANYKFTAADKGVHTFTGIRLKQRGQHTITVADTLTSSIVGTWTITVT